MKNYAPGRWGAAVLVGVLCLGRLAAASEVEPLPEPLTLDYALSLADAEHPDLERIEADLAVARAGILSAKAQTGTNVSAEGRLRWIEPSAVAADDSREDHKGSLFVRKTLYDFGRSSALRQAAAAELRGDEWRYDDARSRRRIEIMERFFDVLLADLEYARDNEAMAVAYVTLDRLRTRHELGQVSDIRLLEMESTYQAVRREMTQSQTRRRITRAQLALALGRPGALPSTLAPPDLAHYLKRQRPEYEELLERAGENSTLLKALRAQVEAAGERVDLARAQGRPYLNGELEASAYTRELGSTDQWRAGVTLTVPLYTGGSMQASVARSQALLQKSRAELRAAEYSLRQSILDLWLQLETLKVQRDQANAAQGFRELYLDRSRANYEMEVSTDLGDAMVRLTEAQILEAKTSYQLALIWARLDALTGSETPQGAGAPGPGID